jgi:HlyD family secretion protein
MATTVTASGALSAITTVLVSSQVSGQMLRILADYNTEVRPGDVIAQIDPLSFQIALEQAQSELNVAEAAVLIQKRGQEKAAADLASAASVMERARFASSASASSSPRPNAIWSVSVPWPVEQRLAG